VRRTLAGALLGGSALGMTMGWIPTVNAEGPTARLGMSAVVTPGAPWNPGISLEEPGDPTIINFVPDGRLVPGDTVRVDISVSLTPDSTAPLLNPTLRAELPPQLIFVRNGTAELDGTALPPNGQPTFSQIGSTLRWQWRSPAPLLSVNPVPNESPTLTVELFARVSNAQAPGTFDGTTRIVTNSAETACETGTAATDASDLDGDGNVIETRCDSVFAVNVQPKFEFTGLFQPIDLDKLNTVKAGSAIPVKFSLNGNQGLDIFVAGSPSSATVGCDTQEPVDSIEQTVTAGKSALSYDATADQYVYVWKTDKAWSGTCRQLNVALSDGSVHAADFKFLK